MKTRNGFVSNSSSSSFIIALDKKPSSVKETQEIFFGNGYGQYSNVSYEYADKPIKPLRAANLIYKQLMDQKPLSPEKIVDEIKNGHFDDYPRINYNTISKAGKYREEYEKTTGKNILNDKNSEEYKKYYILCDEEFRKTHEIVENAANEYFKKQKQKFEGKKAFVVSFSDNDGYEGATMEHGDAFKNVKHIKISHH